MSNSFEIKNKLIQNDKNSKEELCKNILLTNQKEMISKKICKI